MTLPLCSYKDINGSANHITNYLTLWHKTLHWRARRLFEVPADIACSLIGADVVNYAWKLSQPTEEGVLVGSGGMKTRLLKTSNVKCKYNNTRVSLPKNKRRNLTFLRWHAPLNFQGQQTWSPS